MVRYREDTFLRDYNATTPTATFEYLGHVREAVPDTISATEEIQVGNVYSRVHKVGGAWSERGDRLYLAGKVTGKWLGMKTYDLQGRVTAEGSISLADNGVVPYDFGLWNNANRLRYVAASLEEALEAGDGIMERLSATGFVE